MQDEARELHLKLDLCLRIGELLLSSGAGAADVTVTMDSVARHLGIWRPEIDVTFTSLSMSHQPDPEAPAVVQMRVVKQRDIDYEDVTAVDHMVRDLLRGDIDLYMARTRMATIVSLGHPYPRWVVTVAISMLAATLAVFLGGGVVVVAIAGVAGATVDRLQLLMNRRRLPFFYQQVVGGLVATLLAVAVAATPVPVDPSVAISANLIMLLAGIGFLGAIQDALTGFYLTAAARLLEALLATAGIIAGVSGGLSVADLIGIDLGRFVPGRSLNDNPLVLTLGGAVAAVAFAVASYAPRRSLLPIAGVTWVATMIYAVVVLEGVGRTWAAGFAALFVGLVAFSVAGRARIPPLVVVVPGVVPFLPGLSIFRGMSLLAADTAARPAAGLISLMTAASVSVALSAGVILGEYIAQPLKREARRLEHRLSGPRLVGPLRPRTRQARRERRAAREDRDNG